MDDAAEPLGPVLVFSEKHQPIATGLFPLLAKMERQHAERRGRRDRGTRGFFPFLVALSGRTAGADLFAFLHETSIVIREPSCCESSRNVALVRTLLQVSRSNPSSASKLGPDSASKSSLTPTSLRLLCANYRLWPRTDARISSRLQTASVRPSLNSRNFVMTNSGITRRRILRSAATGGLAVAAASGAVGAARAQSPANRPAG